MVPAEVLRTQIAYTTWASKLLVEAAGTLTPEELTRDFGTADKSVLGTLVHVFGADRVWLDRVKGGPANRFLAEEDHRLAVLQNDWPALYERWKEWAGALTDSRAQAEFAYSDRSGNHCQFLLHVSLRIPARHGIRSA